MIIGCPKETKNHEYRVGLTPAGAHVLVAHGHAVLVESLAGARVGFDDAAYIAAGARIVATAEELYASSELVVKVKELQDPEFPLTKPGQILYGYQHLAPDPDLLQHVLDSRITCVAYETVADAEGNLPLLAPMSRIAGRLSPQMGAWALQMANGGEGVLLGGIAGVPPARVVVIGAGNVGEEAVRVAVGMGADVTLFDRGVRKLERLDAYYQGRVKTAVADPIGIAEHVRRADLVIGAVLIPGRLSPTLISLDLLDEMRRGAVIVDVGIDQGGISAASTPSSHSAPLFESHGVLHYCVPNMPSAVARTATLALTQATLPYLVAIANRGLDAALADDPGLAQGLQTHCGRLTHRGLAEDTGRPWQPFPQPQTQ